jgi:release factor glutamine methyltransferase
VTTDEWLDQAIRKLAHAGIEFPQMEARAILSNVLGICREELLTRAVEFDSEDANQLLLRRLGSEPLAYVLGKKEFFRREFSVDRRVLIPRPETEMLVECVIELAREGMNCVDVGTGSGCVGITAQLEVPKTDWFCTDVSRDALDVAHENAKKLQAPVQLIEADLLAPFAAESLDLVASNPPYVAEGDYRLDATVAQWEPNQALFAGDDGLTTIRNLILQAECVLKPGGFIALECGEGQAVEVCALVPDWKPITKRDLAGIERVVVATKPASD